MSNMEKNMSTYLLVRRIDLGMTMEELPGSESTMDTPKSARNIEVVRKMVLGRNSPEPFTRG